MIIYHVISGFQTKRTELGSWISQTHLIANLQDTFGDKVSKSRKYVTPGTPSLSIVCNPLQEVSILQEDYKLYRSGVGMLLYSSTTANQTFGNRDTTEIGTQIFRDTA